MQHKLISEEILPNVDISCVFHINDRVQLRIDGKSCFSRIEDIGPEHIVVAAPISKGKVVGIGPGQKMTVGIVFRETMHEFGCVVSNNLSGRVPTVVLTDLQHHGKVERRHYPRVRDAVPVLFRMAHAAGPWEDSTTDDIGGGGIRVARRDTTRLSVGDMVDVKIMLAERIPINTVCRVLRVRCTPGVGRPWGYWAAEFVHIFPKERSDIISFVEERRAALDAERKRRKIRV